MVLVNLLELESAQILGVPLSFSVFTNNFGDLLSPHNIGMQVYFMSDNKRFLLY